MSKRCEICLQPVSLDEYEAHKENCEKQKETKLYLEEQKHRDDEDIYNKEKIVKITSGLEVEMLMKNNQLGPIFGQLSELKK